MLLKKFNMDITEKMVSFQIIQNALIVKRTLAVVIGEAIEHRIIWCVMGNDRFDFCGIVHVKAGFILLLKL